MRMTDSESNGPNVIRSIAVHRGDVTTALEATLRTDRYVVLRITPPFAGRMRARIHEVHDGPNDERMRAPRNDERNAGVGGEMADTESTTPIHVDPRDLVPEAPPYPEVDETTATYPEADVETRHERHAEQVDAWRTTVRAGIGETVAITTADGTREIAVVVLG